VVHEIGDCAAPRAQPSLVVWIGRVALHMVDDAILTVDQHAATKVTPRSRPSASPGYIEAVLLVAPWSLLHEVLQAAVVLFHLTLLYCFARKQRVAHERSFHVSPSSLSYQSSADFISSTPMRAFATPSMSPSWMRPSATPSIVPRIVVIVQSHE